MIKQYVYVDWTCEDIPRPYYVGKGNQNRIKNLVRNQLHENLRKKYGLRREVVLETDSYEDASLREIELIALYKTYVYDEGNFGSNFTRGGEGVDPDTARLCASKQWKDQEKRQIIEEANQRAWQSRERRLKQSETLKRVLDTDESHDRKRMIMLDRWKDQDYVKSRSEHQRELWQNSDWRRSTSDKIRLAKQTTEEKERQVRVNKQRWQRMSDEERKQVLEKLRLGRCEACRRRQLEKQERENSIEFQQQSEQRRLDAHKNRSEGMKRDWADPEKKRQRSAALRKAWILRKQKMNSNTENHEDENKPQEQ